MIILTAIDAYNSAGLIVYLLSQLISVTFFLETLKFFYSIDHVVSYLCNININLMMSILTAIDAYSVVVKI